VDELHPHRGYARDLAHSILDVLEQDHDVIRPEWLADNWDSHGTSLIRATLDGQGRQAGNPVIEITIRAATGYL